MMTKKAVTGFISASCVIIVFIASLLTFKNSITEKTEEQPINDIPVKQETLSDNFRDCKPGTFTVWGFAGVTYEYKIIWPAITWCKIQNQYYWFMSGSIMVCIYNNKLSIEDAVRDLQKGNLSTCNGDLADYFKTTI